MRIAILGGRIVDPASGTDAEHNVYIADGRILQIGTAPGDFTPEQIIDARGHVVCPGLIDLCARLREPGQEHKTGIADETRAAAAGGITTLVCPPDTDPVIDEPSVVQLIRRRAEAAGYARVLTIGALTHGLNGEQLAEMAGLQQAGCIGVGNGMQPMANTLVVRRAFDYAASFDLTVFMEPRNAWLSGGHAHDGPVAARLGLAGIPVAAETATLARDLALVEDTGVRVHFGRLSCARSVVMLAEAQSRGLSVSGDVSALHLHLTEQDLGYFDSSCHLRPPLRSAADREGLRQGLADGILTAICSDHQPHDADAKVGPFAETEAGASGLETLLALGLALVAEDRLSLRQLIERLTLGPARILGLSDVGRLQAGQPADICIFHPDRTWTPTADTLLSRGHNTPYLGRQLRGRVCYTLFGGRTIYAPDAV